MIVLKMTFSQKKMKSAISLIVLLSLLSACAQQPLSREGDFGSLRPARSGSEQTSASQDIEPAVEAEAPSRFRRPPPVTFQSANVLQNDTSIESQLQGDAVELDVNNLPLPAFIREVFGQQLNLSYLLAPGIEQLTDLVTLSLTEALAPADLYRTARTVLAEYGISIVQEDNLLNFQIDQEISSDVPLIVSGQALPNVPVTHRPVFAMITLSVVRNTSVAGWLRNLFAGTGLEIMEDAARNAILLKGPLELVQQSAEAVTFLDQPLLRGQFSSLITPRYADLEGLLNDLSEVLSAEGYSVSSSPQSGAVIIFPLVSQRSLVVFAASEQTLLHVQDWVEELDTRRQAEVTEGIFSYQAQYVTADHIARLLAELEGDSGNLINAIGGAAQGASTNTNNQGEQSRNTNANSVSGVSYGSGRLVVDDSRNVIFYKGSGQQWLQVQDTIEKLDQPVPSVLIEVLLAEVTLNDQESFGIEWLFNGRGVDGQSLVGSTLGGLDLGGSGITLNSFDSAGKTRALINAFSNNNRAVIRSSPKVLVKSGGTAVIEVGNEIPIITSNSQSTTDSNAPVIQTIQYRKTGVLLTIEPIVQASGLVDIVISQELSEEQITRSSDTGSPIILNRRLETELSLRDGGSVLLGGLISTTQSTGSSSVPVLGDVPILGRLFRADTRTESRTELLMLVIPYVINDNQEAVELTEGLKTYLQLP